MIVINIDTTYNKTTICWNVVHLLIVSSSKHYLMSLTRSIHPAFGFLTIMVCFVVLPSFFFFRARTILFLIFASKPIIFIFITLTYFYASRVFKVAALKRTLGKTVVQRTFELFNAFHFSFNGLIC